LQLNQVVGTRKNFLSKNIPFLIKYGALVILLSINYALNNPKEDPASSTMAHNERELSKNKQNILPLYYLIINIL